MSAKDKRRWIRAWAEDVFRAETQVTAGRINLFGLGAILAILVSLGVAFDAWQALVRTFHDDDYETGLPSLLSHIRTFGVLLLLCVAILALTDNLTPRDRQ